MFCPSAVRSKFCVWSCQNHDYWCSTFGRDQVEGCGKVAECHGEAESQVSQKSGKPEPSQFELMVMQMCLGCRESLRDVERIKCDFPTATMKLPDFLQAAWKWQRNRPARMLNFWHRYNSSILQSMRFDRAKPSGPSSSGSTVGGLRMDRISKAALFGLCIWTRLASWASHSSQSPPVLQQWWGPDVSITLDTKWLAESCVLRRTKKDANSL